MKQFLSFLGLSFGFFAALNAQPPTGIHTIIEGPREGTQIQVFPDGPTLGEARDLDGVLRGFVFPIAGSACESEPAVEGVDFFTNAFFSELPATDPAPPCLTGRIILGTSLPTGSGDGGTPPPAPPPPADPPMGMDAFFDLDNLTVNNVILLNVPEEGPGGPTYFFPAKLPSLLIEDEDPVYPQALLEEGSLGPVVVEIFTGGYYEDDSEDPSFLDEKTVLLEGEGVLQGIINQRTQTREEIQAAVDAYLAEEEKLIQADRDELARIVAEVTAEEARRNDERRVRYNTNSFFAVQGGLLKGDSYGDVVLYEEEKQALVFLKITRLTELVQNLLSLNAIKQGDGTVPEGSLITQPAVKTVGELYEQGRNANVISPTLQAEIKKKRGALLAIPGVAVNNTFLEIRKALLADLIPTAKIIAPLHATFQAALKRYENARFAIVSTISDPDDPYAGGLDADYSEERRRELNQAWKALTAARNAYLAALNGNSLLTAEVNISGFKGPLWEALVKFGESAPSRGQSAINSAIESLANSLRSEITRISGLNDVDGLTREFGSPLYEPLRNKAAADAGIKAVSPQVIRGIGGVAGAYDQNKSEVAAFRKRFDALLTTGQVVLGGVIILAPVTLPVLGPVQLALAGVEVGKAGQQTYLAWEVSTNAEGAVQAGGSTERTVTADFDADLRQESISLGISTVFALVDVADTGSQLIKAASKIDEPIITVAEAGAKRAGDEVADTGVKVIDAEAPTVTIEGPPKLDDVDAGAKTQLLDNKGQLIPPSEGNLIPLPEQVAFSVWTNPNTGESFNLGRRLGQGEFNTVFELVDQPGKVIKFARLREDLAEDALAGAIKEVNDSVKGSQVLGEAGVPQAGVVEHSVKGGQPYTIVESIPESAQTFKRRVIDGVEYDDFIKSGKWTQEHEQAVINLHVDLADKNIAAFDLHIENLYFFRDSDNVLKAGVLDHGQIVRLTGDLEDLEGELGSLYFKRFHVINSDQHSIASLYGLGRKERTPENLYEFYVKLFEDRRYIQYVGGKFVPVRLDPNTIANAEKLRPYINADALPAKIDLPTKSDLPAIGGSGSNVQITVNQTTNSDGLEKVASIGGSQAAQDIAKSAAKSETPGNTTTSNAAGKADSFLNHIQQMIIQQDASRASIPARIAAQPDRRLKLGFVQRKRQTNMLAMEVQ